MEIEVEIDDLGGAVLRDQPLGRLEAARQHFDVGCGALAVPEPPGQPFGMQPDFV